MTWKSAFLNKMVHVNSIRHSPKIGALFCHNVGLGQRGNIRIIVIAWVTSRWVIAWVNSSLSSWKVSLPSCESQFWTCAESSIVSACVQIPNWVWIFSFLSTFAYTLVVKAVPSIAVPLMQKVLASVWLWRGVGEVVGRRKPTQLCLQSWEIDCWL